MDFSQRFKIEGKLGQQRQRKFGEVYRVYDLESEQFGVLKALRKNQVAEHVVNRLRQEATFDFEWDGLPKIIAVHETESELLVVRNYIDAEPINEYWKRIKKRERHAFLLKVLQQLSQIFDHLELHGIVHCDIKPGNILIDGNQRVHLIDFGLALRKTETQDRGILFPLGFAAPELLLNRLHLVDKRTDYYALGILLWSLYEGHLPLTHPNPSVFTNLQLTHPLPESSELSRKMNVILTKLCAKHTFNKPPNQLPEKEMDAALQRGMDTRYGSMHDFLADFEAAQPKGWFRR